MATRAELRRLIGRRTGQKFFRDFGLSNGDADSGTTLTLVDNLLIGEDTTYWQKHFLYLSASDVIRKISSYTPASGTLTWLGATTAVVAGDDYEIWSDFTPQEVHEALNYAIRAAWPFFFQVAVDETLVIQEDAGLIYTLPTTNTIHRLSRVWLIAHKSDRQGSITTQGTTTQVIDSGASFTSADVGKWINVYGDAGVATGNSRQIVTYTSGTTVVVSPAFSVALPVGTDYRMVDKTYMYPTQTPLSNWETDKPDYPTTLWLGDHPSGAEGYNLKIEYEYDFTALTAEATATTIPEEYVLNMGLAYLYFLKTATADATTVEKYQALYQAAITSAQLYVKTHQFRHHPGTINKLNQNVPTAPADYPFTK